MSFLSIFEKENFLYSLRNLIARRARSLLTIVSIFVGITTIFLFVSFGLGLFGYVSDLVGESGADKILVQQRGFSFGTDTTFRLTDADVRVVERSQGIREATGIYLLAVGVEHRGETIFVNSVGYSLDSSDALLVRELFTVRIDEGRDLRGDDSGVVVLGSSYRQPGMLFDSAIELGQRISINGQRFRVVGFYRPLGNPDDDRIVYMSQRDLLRLAGDRNLGYLYIIGRVQEVDAIEQTIDRVTRDLRRSRGLEEGREDFFVQSFDALVESFMVTINVIVGFIIIIALISVVVSAVNTANTMITSVMERTREIGVLKSIGATNGTIRSIFLLESSILGFTAGVIGVFCGWLLAELAGALLLSLGWGFLAPRYTWLLFAGCIIFATVVGMFSGMFPAIYAAKQNPVDALRYE